MKAVRHETEEFTYSARRVYEEIVRQSAFTDSGAEMIHHALEEHLSPVYFCDFLKRYIYRKAGMTLPFQEVPTETYQKIIQAEFQERHVPAAMEPNTARLKNLARLWLRQKTVSRQVVIMLGFGLGMPLEDVNYFLQGALREGRLDPKDPVEVIAWYCFRNQLTYYHFRDFLAQYRSMKSGGAPVPDPGEVTASYQVRLSGIVNQDDLFRYLAFLPTHVREQSVTARQAFDRLYHQVRAMIAAEWNQHSQVDGSAFGGDASGNQPLLADENIHPADVERFLYSSVPRNSHGNLLSLRCSTLTEIFDEKRLTRQRIGKIISGQIPITRFDLMTLNFVIYAVEETEGSRMTAYESFLRSTDQLLVKCGMDPLYIANPYECFLLLCMSAEDPFSTFADVMELSYERKNSTDQDEIPEQNAGDLLS